MIHPVRDWLRIGRNEGNEPGAHPPGRAVPRAPSATPLPTRERERITSMNRRSLAALSIAMLAWAAAFAPAPALASSHSEAPGSSKDRLTDDTDLYAWVAADAPGAVTIVGNWVPLIEPNSGPNFAGFDDAAHYYINVDNAGDSQKHLRFEFRFNTTRQNENTFLYNTGVVTSLTDPDLNVRQSWTLTRVDMDAHTETVIGTGQVA